MTEPAKLNPAFCVFEDFKSFLPDQFKGEPESVWLQRSRRGNFPPYARVLTEKSQAIFSRAEIAAFWQRSFGLHWPRLVESLIESGFPRPEGAPSPHYHAPKRRLGRDT